MSGTLASGSIVSSVVAIYPNHTEAERAVRQLHDAGFALGDLSIVARCEKLTAQPFGLVGVGNCAETGGLFGWLLGLSVGVGFLMMPGLGLLVVTGSIAAQLLAGMEGGVAGTLAGSLIGWGIAKERARKYEKHVEEGKLLVIVRSQPEVVARARTLLCAQGAESIDVDESSAS